MLQANGGLLPYFISAWHVQCLHCICCSKPEPGKGYLLCSLNFISLNNNIYNCLNSYPLIVVMLSHLETNFKSAFSVDGVMFSNN